MTSAIHINGKKLYKLAHQGIEVDRPTRDGLFYERGDWNGTELSKMDTICATMTDEGKQCFEQWMKECADENIQVLLVNSPMYIGATNKTVGLSAVNAYFDSIAQANHTKYRDYTNDEICTDSNNFVVSVHMNPEATHRFSIDVANRIKLEWQNE